MFAFALWDAPKQRLLLARDRLGVKPLYWARRGDLLLFGSEIKAILASGLVEAQPTSRRSRKCWARATPPAPTRCSEDHKLLPGHRLVFERGTRGWGSTWDVPHRSVGPGDSTARRERRRTVSRAARGVGPPPADGDVPLGMFLSGGIDSSAVAALMARQIDRPLETFSVAFEDRAFSELAYAREVAKAVGAEAHEVVIDDRDFFGALPRLLWHEDEPIAHPSSVPLYFVSALARQHVKVVLTGEGSDELLAGYGKYLRAPGTGAPARSTSGWSPAARGPLPQGSCRGAEPDGPLRPALVSGHGSLAGSDVLRQLRGDPPAQQQRAARRRSPARRDTREHLRDVARALPASERRQHLLDRLLYTDIKTYLVELLMKQDQMSMAASIESRVPFLDHELVEFAARLPDR